MEPLRHECDVAMIRLRKPLHYYQEKYGTWQYGLNKLYLLMEKQHNRGQEGAGMACVKMHAAAGEEYMFRERALGSGAITEIFDKAHREVDPPLPTRAPQKSKIFRGPRKGGSRKITFDYSKWGESIWQRTNGCG